MLFQGANQRHRLFSNSGYNLPRPRFMFFVNFVTTNVNQQTAKQISFFCKRVDRINTTYDVQEMNQYNKKRLIQTKMSYGNLNFALHDTIDESATKLIQAYNSFYYGDHEAKNNTSWAQDVVGANFEFTNNWGLKGNQTANNSNFFERIEVYEMFDQNYSQINFINPKLVSVNFQQLDQEISGGTDVEVNCQYEGYVVEKLGVPITSDIAEKFGLPFNNSFGPTTGFIVPQVVDDVLANTGINNVLRDIGFRNSFNVGNILGSVLSITPINTIGGGIFTPTSGIPSVLDGVARRITTGNNVRDIAVGTFSNTINNILKF